MLKPKRTAVCRLAKIFIEGNVLLCCLTNLFIMHRIQHPSILGNHWPWAVYTRSCSISFSEISLSWHGICLLLYDNLCLEYSVILCFPLSPLLFSLSSYSLVAIITSFIFHYFFSFSSPFLFSMCESTSSAFARTN